LFLDLNFLNIKKILHYLLFISFILFPFDSYAAGKIEVKGIRYWSSPNYTRVVVDLSGTVEFSKNRLSDPDRLYFDLMDTTFKKEDGKNIPVEDGILKKIRAAQFKPDIVRVVLDLEELKDLNVFLLDNPPRFVVDIYGKGKAESSDTFTAKKRIVIDPGHGGHDPGAIGPNRLYEKDVVLDISLKLRKILSKDKSNEVFLTRETDVYIPLEERTAIANRKGADLFISIHANASPRRQAKGIETYLLNWTDDEEAMRVAARENAISLKKMKEMHRNMDIVQVITDDLMRQNKRDESVKLANYIQRSMIDSLTKSFDLGVKQALFYVLFGARMPSVLVEVSFISNPEEESLLSQESYRMQIAEAIAQGIDTYFTSTPSFQRTVELRNTKTL
jgi:N-acetylmuramoyl-L-alanine amidase